jgi:hypothetical protein
VKNTLDLHRGRYHNCSRTPVNEGGECSVLRLINQQPRLFEGYVDTGVLTTDTTCTPGSCANLAFSLGSASEYDQAKVGDFLLEEATLPEYIDLFIRIFNPVFQRIRQCVFAIEDPNAANFCHLSGRLLRHGLLPRGVSRRCTHETHAAVMSTLEAEFDHLPPEITNLLPQIRRVFGLVTQRNEPDRIPDHGLPIDRFKEKFREKIASRCQYSLDGHHTCQIGHKRAYEVNPKCEIATHLDVILDALSAANRELLSSQGYGFDYYFYQLNSIREQLVVLIEFVASNISLFSQLEPEIQQKYREALEGYNKTIALLKSKFPEYEHTLEPMAIIS